MRSSVEDKVDSAVDLRTDESIGTALTVVVAAVKGSKYFRLLDGEQKLKLTE
jgi:hypothetical protein